ncbi:MAG TPA: DUF4397 domain-containing protein [Patescibacteria group bacterium]|nr:DUF4397 domain-containing protein [Patescibacteria group bacterium]
MKIPFKNLYIVGFCISCILYAGCTEDVLQTPERKASVQFVNAVTQIPVMGVKVQQQQVLKDLPYGSASGYRAVEAGKPRSIQIDSAGVKDIDRPTSYMFAHNGNYSVMIFSSASRITILPLIDTLRADPNGKARFRFVHLDETVDEVEVLLFKNSNSNGITPFPYPFFSGENSQYALVEPGMYSLVLREPGSSSDVARLDDFVFSNHKNYTFYTFKNNQATSIRVIETNTR